MECMFLTRIVVYPNQSGVQENEDWKMYCEASLLNFKDKNERLAIDGHCWRAVSKCLLVVIRVLISVVASSLLLCI